MIDTMLQVEQGGQQYQVNARYSGPQDGEPIVMVHGWGDNQRVFDSAVRHPALRGYQLFGYDMLGFGRSEKPESFAYRLEDQAAMLAGLIRSQFPDGAHLVGHSMGGVVGLLAAEQLGDTSKTFTSIEGNLVSGDTSSVVRSLAHMTPGRFRAVGKPAVRLALAFTDRQRRTAWQQAAPYALQRSAVSLAEWSDSGQLAPLLQRTPQATYVAGQRSSRADTALLALDGRTPIVLIENAGHTPMRDNPDALYDNLAHIVAGRPVA